MEEEKMEDDFKAVTSPFDAIRHLDGDREFWQARELSKILGYNRWENFENVIAKAKIACKYNERDVDDHFREVTKMTKAGKGAKRLLLSQHPHLIFSQFAMTKCCRKL